MPMGLQQQRSKRTREGQRLGAGLCQERIQILVTSHRTQRCEDPSLTGDGMLEVPEALQQPLSTTQCGGDLHGGGSHRGLGIRQRTSSPRIAPRHEARRKRSQPRIAQRSGRPRSDRRVLVGHERLHDVERLRDRQR